MKGRARCIESYLRTNQKREAGPGGREFAPQLIETYTDISSFIEIMSATIQDERTAINSERLRLNGKAHAATFWTNALFLLGWIATVGAKLERVDAVVG